MTGGDGMPQFFKRRPELISAEQYRPGRAYEGLIRTRSPGHMTDAVDTTSGRWVLATDDWIVTHADGMRSVYPDELFRMAFEPA